MPDTVSPLVAPLAIMGPLANLLHDEEVVEISLNSDQKLWIVRFGSPSCEEGAWTAGDAERMIRWCASRSDSIIDSNTPIASMMLPGYPHRIEALLPPVVAAPVFSIRRHTHVPVDLETFSWPGDAERMARTGSRPQSPGQPRRRARDNKCAGFVKRLLSQRKNLVIAGATGSGKTTFANACLRALARTDPTARVVLIEDTPELQSDLPNTVFLRTSATVDQHRLLVSTLRLAPERIVVGECRDGPAAMTLLRAWNTGHGGGITTVHANSAKEVVPRLDMLCSEVAATSQEKLIRAALDAVIFLDRDIGRPVVREILEISP